LNQGYQTAGDGQQNSVTNVSGVKAQVQRKTYYGVSRLSGTQVE
jgi:hypothetical protein